MRFEFQTATRVVFGPGTRAELPAILRGLDQPVLVVSGRSSSPGDDVSDGLTRSGIATIRVRIHGEPTVADARAGVELARAEHCRTVVSVGGGSAIDAGKAIAVLATNPGDPLDYLEVIGGGRPLERPGLPFVAVPTTSGSGAEVTRNAVLGSPEHGVKASLRSALMLPLVALVDPELTRGLPPAVTAGTGLDAIAQLVEPYLSARATPVTDALCREGLLRASRALPVAFHDGANANAREDMALASLFGGMALANAGLGAVHGFAGPIGGRFPAPHGAVCAALLPAVLRANVRALAERDPASPARARADQLGQWVTGRAGACAIDAVEWLEALARELAIPALGTYGVAEDHVADLVERARRASSMRGNPIELTDDELADILHQAI
jgi:alcohol dehydrogenase class IV